MEYVVLPTRRLNPLINQINIYYVGPYSKPSLRYRIAQRLLNSYDPKIVSDVWITGTKISLCCPSNIETEQIVSRAINLLSTSFDLPALYVKRLESLAELLSCRVESHQIHSSKTLGKYTFYYPILSVLSPAEMACLRQRLQVIGQEYITLISVHQNTRPHIIYRGPRGYDWNGQVLLSICACVQAQFRTVS